MSGRLEGKTALVTGGTAGIGLATAQRFVKEGAYVFVTGRRQAELDSAAKLVRGHVTAVKADSSNLDDLDNLFAQINLHEVFSERAPARRWAAIERTYTEDVTFIDPEGAFVGRRIRDGRVSVVRTLIAP
jgi:NAD(P)-dependent dehydrogenase (short-subunit alcohol dehydrogenase family)